MLFVQTQKARERRDFSSHLLVKKYVYTSKVYANVVRDAEALFFSKERESHILFYAYFCSTMLFFVQISS